MTFVLIDNNADRSNTGANVNANANVNAHVNASAFEPSCLFEHPVQIITAHEPQDIADALAQLERGLANGLTAAGFFSYELGYVLEPRLAQFLPDNRTVPLLWFGLFSNSVETTELSSPEVSAWITDKAESYYIKDLLPSMSAAHYGAKFKCFHNKIAAGDIYQINQTFKMRFNLIGCPLGLYKTLRGVQKTAFSAYIKTDDFNILSLSPELFISRHGKQITTKPMKGTQARGGNEASDACARQELAASTKQRAENLMIVDLMRNDISRISEVGSVAVKDLFAIDSYPTLHQMISTVRGTIRNGVGLRQMLTALFPPGSITGAPKIAAMELIAQHEPQPRGVYTGVIGMIKPSGDAQFNVAIRTLLIASNGNGELGIGSGIVADSIEQDEYKECLLKASFLKQAIEDKPFKLIETMLYEADKPEADCSAIWLFDEHLSRLKRSAAYFGFSYDEPTIRAKLLATISAQQERRLRLRLLLAADGKLSLSAIALPRVPSAPLLRFAISDKTIRSGDIFLAHKTTRRQLFDADFQRYGKQGADEVLYCNERGELTEGSRSTIFLQLDGKLVTPDLQAGVLPGTLRAHYLATGLARQAVLKAEHLEQAQAIFLGNSVRGLQAAVAQPA